MRVAIGRVGAQQEIDIECRLLNVSFPACLALPTACTNVIVVAQAATPRRRPQRNCPSVFVIRHAKISTTKYRMMIEASLKLDLEKLGNHSKAPKEPPISSKIAQEKTGSIGAS